MANNAGRAICAVVGSVILSTSAYGAAVLTASGPGAMGVTTAFGAYSCMLFYGLFYIGFLHLETDS